MIFSLVIFSIISVENFWPLSETSDSILPYSMANSPWLIDLSLIDKILLLDKTLPSPRKPPNVATRPKIIIPTIIDDPDEVKPFLILDNADIF